MRSSQLEIVSFVDDISQKNNFLWKCDLIEKHWVRSNGRHKQRRANIAQYNIYAFNCLSWSLFGCHCCCRCCRRRRCCRNRVLFWLFCYNSLSLSLLLLMYFADIRNKIIPLAGAFYKNSFKIRMFNKTNRKHIDMHRERDRKGKQPNDSKWKQ